MAVRVPRVPEDGVTVPVREEETGPEGRPTQLEEQMQSHKGVPKVVQETVPGLRE